MTITLRDYQEEAVCATFDYFAENTGNPLLVLPTGAGKSIVIAEFIRRALAIYPDTRIIVLSHVAELLEQDQDKLLEVWPDAPCGVYCAGLKKRESQARVLFASIQSVWNKAFKIQKCDIVIIDECHLLSPNDRTRYRKFLADLQKINGEMVKVIGASATPYRLDSGWLHEGKNAMFTDIAYEISILELIEMGFLSPLTTKRTKTRLDTTGVGTRGGEFIAGQLQAAVDKDEITSAAVDEIVEWGADRRTWLVFASGVQHAYHVRDEIRRRGVTAEVITGETPKDERKRLIQGAKDGTIRCLVNFAVLTTGVDIPGIDLIAFLRPTKSTSLYVQMAGRGMRLFIGKINCLVLDFAKVVSTHGPVDKVRVKNKKGEGSGEAPTKVCPNCESEVFAGARECADCGYVFPPPEVKILPEASNAAILSTQIEPEWMPVQKVFYTRHEKPGKPPSLKLAYVSGLRQFPLWVCPEHTGMARKKFVTWWMGSGGNAPPPMSVYDAINRRTELMTPSRILVRPNGKYYDVVTVEYPDADMSRMSA